MTFRHLLAQSLVSDLAAAETWYTTVLGSPPDLRPMEGLLEWHLGDAFGVQVFRHPERAGRSTMVLEETDLDDFAARLTAGGIPFDGPQPVTASRVVVLSDPEGNQVVVSGV